MAFHSQRFKAFLGRFSVARYSLSPRTSPSSLVSFFSTNKPRSFSSTVLEEEDLPIEIATNSTRVFDESELLQELSELLPIRYKKSSSNISVPYPLKKPTQIDAGADDFLPVEDKLRGVFLQKLKGKAAIENALTDSITKDLELTVDTVGKVVNRGNLGGEAMDAFFTWAVKQPTVPIDLSTYHVILKALGRRKFFDLMLGKLHDMHAKGICPNCETLEIVIDSLVRASRIAKAIDLFEKLEDFGMECGTGCFNVLLQCLCRRRHVGKANSLLNSKREKIEFDSMTYNIVIGGWSKMGRVSEMEKSLKAMVEDGFTADCLTYRYLIEGLGRASQIDNAVRIFKRIENEGCTLDTGVYNAMINNCISVGDFDECMRYYEQMLRLNCLPNNDTYVKLIGAFLKAQKVSDALEMFDAMLHRGIVPTSGILTSFIEPLCRYGPPHAAMIIYKNAKRIGCRISMSAYKLLLMRLSRFGKCGMLLQLWEDMQESGYSSDKEVYEYVINGLCNNGQLESAVLVVEESLRKGFCPSRLIYSKLNNKLLASNKTERAYKLFLKMKDARWIDNARRYWRSNGWHF